MQPLTSPTLDLTVHFVDEQPQIWSLCLQTRNFGSTWTTTPTSWILMATFASVYDSAREPDMRYNPLEFPEYDAYELDPADDLARLRGSDD